MQQDYDSSASGYLTDAMEGISQTFTDVEIITTSEINVVAKAKRYGRWWLLKGLQKEVVQEAGYQQRLRKELEILMLLQHPFIVAPYGIEEVAGLGRCIVMEYVDGTTLKEWLLNKKHNRQERRRVAMELTEAVAYIHSKGIVHRDLKPENIIITNNGENVKLIDFGLADTDSYAVLKQPAGTRQYMSPEQAQTAVADSRNDIYSLGIIFSRMDIGQKSVINKCLLPIDRRYQHIEELRHDLQSHEGRAGRAVIAVLAIAVTILIMVTGWQWQKMSRQEKLLAQKSTSYQQEQTKQRQQLNFIHDSLKVLQTDRNQIRAKEKQAIQQRLRVKEAIHKGYVIIDKANRQSGMEQFLDTLSDIRYVYTNYSDKVTTIYQKVYEYWQLIEKDFNDTEMTEIKDAMGKYYSKQAEHWNNKIKQLSR